MKLLPLPMVGLGLKSLLVVLYAHFLIPQGIHMASHLQGREGFWNNEVVKAGYEPIVSHNMLQSSHSIFEIKDWLV